MLRTSWKEGDVRDFDVSKVLCWAGCLQPEDHAQGRDRSYVRLATPSSLLEAPDQTVGYVVVKLRAVAMNLRSHILMTILLRC